MTPQERQLIDGLFDRLASLEGQPRDPEAAAAIAEGLRRAPNALYALVQTVLVQDEALARANDRIEALTQSGEPPAGPGGFLDSMREMLSGGSPRRGGSVPASGTAWSGAAAGERPAPATARSGGGGSFLGTAAAAAAGVVGGSLLMTGIRDLMGGSEKGQSLAGSSEAGKEDLAREAGLDDVGAAQGDGDDGRHDRGGYDTAAHDGADDFDDSDFGFDDTDFG